MPKLDPPEHLPNNTRTFHPPSRTLFLVAGVAVVCGLFIIAAAAGYIGSEADFNAPRWLVGWFGGLFIGAGLFLGIPAWLRARPVPQGPAWRRDRNWDSRGIHGDSGRRLRSHILSLIGIALFIAPFHLFFMQQDWVAPTHWFDYSVYIWPLMLGVFELIILLSFLQWLKRLAARPRYGPNRLEFASFPYQLGRNMEARLQLSRKLADADLEIELRCVQDRVVRRGSGDNEREEVQAFALYGDRRTATLDHHARTRIVFPLPADLPATNLRANPAHYWELVARAPQIDPDFQAVFLLPVYA